MKHPSEGAPGLRRREFLRQVAASAALLPLASAAGCGSPPTEFSRRPLLVAYFGDGALADARVIGARYVRSLGGPDAAAEAVRPTDALAYRHTDEADAVLALEMAVREEFARRDYYSLDGWILAPTELNLRALAHFETA